MLAPQNFEPGIGDLMSNTSIAKWYDDFESCFNDSEVIPGTYEYTTATAWGTQEQQQKELVQILL